MLSLLSLQAELMYMRHQLEQIWQEQIRQENGDDMEYKKAAFSFNYMFQPNKQGESISGDSVHFQPETETKDKWSEAPTRICQESDLIMRIRDKLRVYSKCPYAAFFQSQ